MNDFKTWEDMRFWQSGEWQVIQERLDDLEKSGDIPFTPKRTDIFKAFEITPYSSVKVAIFGQDPYPNPDYATGIAFSIPRDRWKIPATLVNILQEYSRDLHYQFPTHGDLSSWADSGVFLFNVIPTCQAWGKPLSHYHWPEWPYLTREVIERLNDICSVFVFMGGVAREYKGLVREDRTVIETSHPSLRSHDKGSNPFTGSRVFTTINSHLVKNGREPVNWRLP